MSPIAKYSIARLALFVAVAAALLAVPFDVSPLIKLMIALLVSMALSFFLLRGLRDEVAAQAAGMVQRRAEKKDRLRAALNGDDERAGSTERAIRSDD